MNVRIHWGQTAQQARCLLSIKRSLLVSWLIMGCNEILCVCLYVCVCISVYFYYFIFLFSYEALGVSMSCIMTQNGFCSNGFNHYRRPLPKKRKNVYVSCQFLPQANVVTLIHLSIISSIDYQLALLCGLPDKNIAE